MRVRQSFPHDVKVIENCWIPMPDGCRLAARIWMPADAPEHPVPAIVEYIPYRKRFGTRWRDEPMHRYFAGHGYASLRVDLRGSGESDGLLRDEYLEREQLDGVDVIRWVAAQPWCAGTVGMMGKSWGGFNSLQVAARRPPQLKAIITVCATDDRYRDDAHYMGGCLLNENLIWGSVLYTLNALPPDPALVGERWRAMWLERLEEGPLFPEIWLRHQRRDAYWRNGSVCENWSAIEVPVYAVSGWADGYTNAVFRLLAGLRCPRKGLVGPWAHLYPHEGVPGPAIGFLQEAVRWWDHWLKDDDTGIMQEPMLRVWLQESVRPSPTYDTRPGRWVAEPTWPPEQPAAHIYALNENGLDTTAGAERALSLRSPLSVGAAAGSWCGFGVEGEHPTDQREDDGRSLVFDTPPLGEPLEVLGAPVVQLHLSVDRPLAMLAVRLNDVWPDGASARVSYGILNLAHRDSHEAPAPLVPGERYVVSVRLNDAAHVFPRGHRVRVAVSTSYWPVAWPSPEPATLTVFAGASTVELPVRAPRDEDRALRPFEPPESAPPTPSTDLHPGGIERAITRDVTTGEMVHTTRIDEDDEGGVAISHLEDIALDVGHAVVETFTIGDDDPTSATAEITHRYLLRRGDWEVGISTQMQFDSTPVTFRLRSSLEAREGDKTVFSRSVERVVPRDRV